MGKETNSIASSTSRNDPSRSHPGPDFGAMLHSRRLTGTGYFLAAAFMLVPLPMVALYAIITGPPEPLGYNVFTMALTIGIGAVGAAPFVWWGLKQRGMMIEAYENGMRFAWPSGRESAFLFAEVKEMKRQTFKGALAKLTFVLVDGRSHTIGVHGPKDVVMIQDVLARFGPVSWEADRGFRIM